MRRAAPLLLLLAAAATSAVINTTTVLTNDTIILGEHAVFIANDTIVDGNKTIVIGNDTIIETDGEHAPIVRKKRTFGDIVFRGLADVFGYDVQRKPGQAAFPPPLDPVPGIDGPFQQDGPAPPPCGAPRAPPPCRPPPPPPPPPCPKPKPRPPPPPPCCPKPPPPPPPPPCCPKPPPPPPPPPCCPKPPPPPPPPPCCPKPPPPPPPPPPPCPKPRGPCAAKDETDAELVTSNLQLSFNINRNRPNQAPATDYVEDFAPIAIEPRAARLPAKQERKPQVFVDAFVVRDGAKRKVDTVDADVFNTQQAALDDDYITYDDDEAPQQVEEDDYEDIQEPQDKAQRQRLANQFWEKKKSKNLKKLPRNHYKNVHFGDRDFANKLQRRSDSSESHQNLQRERPKSNRVPLPFSRDTDEEYEETTTTEDPRRQLRPRVLPPTEHNPNQIDTVTVRVPPIYKEKRPKKLHRGPDRDDEDNQEVPYYYNNSNEDDSDSDGENSRLSVQTEPTRQKRRKKSRRRTRSTRENQESAEKEGLKEYDPLSEFDYDYYGKKLPISDEEKSFRQFSIPEPTKNTGLARIEESPFLDDHERLVEDPERIGEDERLDDSGRSDNSGRSDDSGRSDESGKTDDSGRTHDKEKIVEDRERSYDDNERTDERQRADSSERTDTLSPHAEIRETGYRNNYLKKTNIRHEDPRPLPQRRLKKKKA